jgi:hypothetical protein
MHTLFPAETNAFSVGLVAAVLVVCASFELPQAVTASAKIRIGGSQRTGRG